MNGNDWTKIGLTTELGALDESLPPLTIAVLHLSRGMEARLAGAGDELRRCAAYQLERMLVLLEELHRVAERLRLVRTWLNQAPELSGGGGCASSAAIRAEVREALTAALPSLERWAELSGDPLLRDMWLAKVKDLQECCFSAGMEQVGLEQCSEPVVELAAGQAVKRVAGQAVELAVESVGEQPDVNEGETEETRVEGGELGSHSELEATGEQEPVGGRKPSITEEQADEALISPTSPTSPIASASSTSPKPVRPSKPLMYVQSSGQTRESRRRTRR
ncbi:hypothetical protein [Paenibacillus koleovorans]|uniref:hypothetical protein n=1 Tax=Paenibacillus koleovorans TaxID=121608 RepID=UPI000FD993F1|nr:hypothetical protein [Paenibacillus koleovorans]